MIHPNVSLQFINDTVGHGLVAMAPIPAGTITWCLDPLDILLTAEEARALGPLYAPTLDRFSWTDRDGLRVFCWDAGRFMNHSCRPNSMSPGLSFEMALRDLAPGDELLCDYGTLNLDESFECACGEPTCRGEVRPEDFDTHAARWDAGLQAIFPNITVVEQPLLSLVPATERAQLDAWSAAPAQVPSVLSHRFPPVLSASASSPVLLQ